ncbi:MAG: invertase [Lentisphaerae bacterium RIFOXYA12_FULL_48_11]|nr:MAG: invertase [Lentisphaerae bacterium RIFOXYA12_FULL_48_11]
MNYGYIRVSTAMQKESADTQKFGILQLANEKKITINSWVIETVTGSTKASERQLGVLLGKLNKGDTLIVAEVSRLGRSLLDVMTTLNLCMTKGIFVFTVKEKFELADNINSKVLAFAFGLAAEIERQMISQRTKESLQRLKSEGRILGRPKGSKSASKLDGKEDAIKGFLEKGVSKASIAKILDVHPGTLDAFIKTRGLVSIENGKPELAVH